MKTWKRFCCVLITFISLSSTAQYYRNEDPYAGSGIESTPSMGATSNSSFDMAYWKSLLRNCNTSQQLAQQAIELVNQIKKSLTYAQKEKYLSPIIVAASRLYSTGSAGEVTNKGVQKRLDNLAAAIENCQNMEFWDEWLTMEAMRPVVILLLALKENIVRLRG